MKKIAVIGLGNVGNIHVDNVSNHEDAVLSAVCDTREEIAQAAATKTGAIATTTTEQLLDTAPDAVVIASSTATHEDIIRDCIQAQIPFLCEKPLARNLEAAQEIVALVAENQLVAATALNRRFDRQYAAMRDALKSGQIGQPELLCFTSRSTSPPSVEFSRTSGGLFAEKGSHFFDLARWISGSEPLELSAMGSVLVDPGFREIGEFDTAVISLRLQSGAICRFDFSWRTAYGQDERIEIHGTNGLLTSFQDTVGTTVHPDGRQEISERQLSTWQSRFANTYKAELDALLSFLETGEPHPTLATLHDGLMAQRMGEAARLSATIGQTQSFQVAL